VKAVAILRSWEGRSGKKVSNGGTAREAIDVSGITTIRARIDFSVSNLGTIHVDVKSDGTWQSRVGLPFDSGDYIIKAWESNQRWDTWRVNFIASK
jgi:hypothetical protein